MYHVTLEPPDPARRETTLAIILGASEWPKCDDFIGSPAFEKSAADFVSYLLDENKYGLPKENVKDFFNCEVSSADIFDGISSFLEDRIKTLRPPGSNQCIDLIVYYVGHGGLHSLSYELYLTIKDTRKSHPSHSSIESSALADVLKRDARFIRRYIILDCCFAAAAVRHFQGSEQVKAAFKQLEDVLPPEGTALLCSSSKDKVSILSKESSCTLFSGALLHVLENGHESAPNPLSLYDVSILIENHIQSVYPGGPRPELHIPNQDRGNISIVGLFPNRCKKRIFVKHNISLWNRSLWEFYRLIRDAVCYNQGELAQYSVLAADLHGSIRAALQAKPIDQKVICGHCDRLLEFLNRNFWVVSKYNFSFIKRYFHDRHKVEPRICIKASIEKNGEKYITDVFRDVEVKYQTEFPISKNSGFWFVTTYGRAYVCNNIPRDIAEKKYTNVRIEYNKAIVYWENKKSQDSSWESDFDQGWIECWVRQQKPNGEQVPLEPTSCYKSTFITPMTLWNNNLHPSYIDIMKLRGYDVERTIYGYLCFDHIEENYFTSPTDEDIGYIFADILSLYMMTQLHYSELSETFNNAKKLCSGTTEKVRQV